MTIRERIDFYKWVFKDCKAIDPVKSFVMPEDRIEALEAIRDLNTTLADLYWVSIPVIICWVRDNSYVPETGEIYLTEPDLESFLHLFRHHLQNVERKYERRGLTTEGKLGMAKIPYLECIYKMRGEDDAIAWSKFLIELAGAG